MKSKKAKIAIAVVSAVLIIILIAFFVVLPPTSGKLKASADGIAEKAYIDVDSTRLGMVLKGENKNNPVLLILGGGPGIPDYWLEYEYPSQMDKYFTLCYLSYRGTALSYDADLSKNAMTTARFQSDAIAVTNYLRERFGQDKIYLMGHSFGTTVALRAAAEHPELYKAYVGMSMCVNQPLSERLAYDYMLSQFENNGDKSMAREMKKYSSCFTDNAVLSMSDEMTQAYFAKTRDKAMHKLGVGTTRDMKSVVTGIFFPSLRMKDFTVTERINVWKGKSFAADTAVVEESFNFVAAKEVSKLNVPFYVFAGKYDYTTAYSTQKEFFDFVDADVKGFYTFENSAHSPVFEEPTRAVEIFTTDVLKGTVTLAD